MNASDKVYNYIEKNILKGVWKAGDKITPELTLVKELEVSRLSVRAAIEKMVALGVLRKQRGGGTYVNEVNSTTYIKTLVPLLTMNRVSYIEILEFRLATDALAVEKFIENWNEAKVEELKKVHETMKVSFDDPEKFLQLDMQFHRVISQGSENGIIAEMTTILFDITEYYTRDEYHLLTPDKRIKEHSIIFEAIMNKDTELAVIYTKRHLMRTIEELKKAEKINK